MSTPLMTIATTEGKIPMPSKNNWHPLQIAGLALLSISLVFSLLLFALQMDAVLGVVVGCAITGLVLSTVGFALTKRARTRHDSH